MFLDEIDKRYPRRVLAAIELNHIGFQANFDLPKKHHLSVSIHVHQMDEQRMEVYELVRETSSSSFHFSQAEHYTIEPVAIHPLLIGYLSKAIGDVKRHLYSDGFVGPSVIQLLRKDEVQR
jgi:hypothetical protein